MRVLRPILLFVLPAFLIPEIQAAECNYWPIKVEQSDPGAASGRTSTSTQAFGPLLFSAKDAQGGVADGFRPFFVARKSPDGKQQETNFLYPLLINRRYGGENHWSFLELINSSKPSDPAAPGIRSFDVWPFYFSRQTGEPDTSYRAVFPLQGHIVHRLGYDRLDWALFPIYARFERHGVATTSMFWPIFKDIEGDGNHGFAVWPLIGHRVKEGVSRDDFALWPLLYRRESRLGTPEASSSIGVLPFYARDLAPGSRSETFLWPFFGYTHRTAPYRYDEARWLWPFLVQGSGDSRLVNRWAPFYTHSNIKGNDKRWVLWPVFRQQAWTDGGIAQTKTQVLYFVYWSLRQERAGGATPASPAAEKTHLWPLYSYWNNGAGSRQLQLVSPLEVFFQANESVRLSYSPLFALFRYERSGAGEVRSSLLWNAISWRRSPGQREFHLGPLFSVDVADDRRRVAVGCGLISFRRQPGGPWRLRLFDFSDKADKPPQSTVSK